MRERFKRFNFLIAKLQKYVQKIKTEEMSEFNLKGPHVTCMSYLYARGELTAKDIRVLSGEDKASISRSLDYLEENGYVVCDSMAVKRYNAKYSLTEKGNEVGARLTDKINNITQIVSKGVSDENRAIMYNALEIIAYNLEDYFEKIEK